MPDETILVIHPKVFWTHLDLLGQQINSGYLLNRVNVLFIMVLTNNTILYAQEDGFFTLTNIKNVLFIMVLINNTILYAQEDGFFTLTNIKGEEIRNRNIHETDINYKIIAKSTSYYSSGPSKEYTLTLDKDNYNEYLVDL